MPAEQQPTPAELREHADQIAKAISAAHAGQQIDRLETHISHVFLVEQTAYKVKKPVDLGFCNFTSLSQRRHYCHEELRLNRRLAPNIYLDVCGFAPGDDGQSLQIFADDPQADNSKECVEYAVRMRRFEQDQLLSHLAKSGNLRTEWFDELAQTLADFHRRAPVAKSEQPAGTPQRVWQPVEECLATIESSAQRPETQELVARLRSWSKQEFQRLIAWFEERKQESHIRECHGDLHLGNMVLQEGRIVVFDCIEFNDALRWIDTSSDVAFAVMDLHDRNAAQLGRRLLNAYLEATDDYAMLTGFRFYTLYRALVRAKVASLRHQQTQASSPDHEAAAVEFHNYLNLATRETKPHQPWLAIMHGLSGSGKSTAAMRLVEELAAVRVRSDIVRRRQFQDVAIRYSPAATEWTYDRLGELAEGIISSGFPVVIDATFLRADERHAFQQLAGNLNVPFAIVDCQGDPDVLRARIFQRRQAGGDPSEADLNVLESQLQAHDELSPAEREFAFGVDIADAASVDRLIADLRVQLGFSAE